MPSTDTTIHVQHDEINQVPTERLSTASVAPEAYRAMRALENYIHQSGLEESLVHLLKLRASYINGCAYCVDMHWKDLRAIGENEQRLYSLDA